MTIPWVEPADQLEPIEVVGLGAWREHHPLNRPMATVAAAVEESSTG